MNTYYQQQGFQGAQPQQQNSTGLGFADQAPNQYTGYPGNGMNGASGYAHSQHQGYGGYASQQQGFQGQAWGYNQQQAPTWQQSQVAQQGNWANQAQHQQVWPQHQTYGMGQGMQNMGYAAAGLQQQPNMTNGPQGSWQAATQQPQQQSFNSQENSQLPASSGTTGFQLGQQASQTVNWQHPQQASQNLYWQQQQQQQSGLQSAVSLPQQVEAHQGPSVPQPEHPLQGFQNHHQQHKHQEQGTQIQEGQHGQSSGTKNPAEPRSEDLEKLSQLVSALKQQQEQQQQQQPVPLQLSETNPEGKHLQQDVAQHTSRWADAGASEATANPPPGMPVGQQQAVLQPSDLAQSHRPDTDAQGQHYPQAQQHEAQPIVQAQELAPQQGENAVSQPPLPSSNNPTAPNLQDGNGQQAQHVQLSGFLHSHHSSLHHTQGTDGDMQALGPASNHSQNYLEAPPLPPEPYPFADANSVHDLQPPLPPEPPSELNQGASQHYQYNDNAPPLPPGPGQDSSWQPPASSSHMPSQPHGSNSTADDQTMQQPLADQQAGQRQQSTAGSGAASSGSAANSQYDPFQSDRAFTGTQLGTANQSSAATSQPLGHAGTQPTALSTMSSSTDTASFSSQVMQPQQQPAFYGGQANTSAAYQQGMYSGHQPNPYLANQAGMQQQGSHAGMYGMYQQYGHQQYHGQYQNQFMPQQPQQYMQGMYGSQYRPGYAQGGNMMPMQGNWMQPTYGTPHAAAMQGTWGQPQPQMPTPAPVASAYPASGYAQPQATAPTATSIPKAPATPLNVVDVSTLLLPPGRAKRPKKMLFVLRGLPGSGKSHVAKKIRELEMEQGGEAPRVLSLDEYFVTEVEKEVSVDEGGRKGKKQKVVELEYVHDAEQEATYQRELVRSVGKTCEGGRFSLVIVDTPAIRAEDVKELCSVGQRCHYEVYVLQPLYTDPKVCHQQNIHGRSLKDIEKLAAQFEPAPAVYNKLDVASLFGGKPAASAIEEVQMDDGSEGEEDTKDGTAPQGDTPAVSASSRWHDDEEQGSAPKASKSGKRKASSAASDQELLDSLNDFLKADHGKGIEGAIKRSKEMLGALDGSKKARRKSVRWRDQETVLFGQRAGELEEVFWVEGLGPPKELYAETVTVLGTSHKSFSEQVKAEHNLEHDKFRQVLLGLGGQQSLGLFADPTEDS